MSYTTTEYEEAVAEYVALRTKLRDLKNEYDVNRWNTLTLYKEAHKKVSFLKQKLAEGREKNQAD
jgi:hypothetical protein